MPSREMLDATRQATGLGGRPEESVVTAAILGILGGEAVRRVIDLGCGRGDLAAALVRRGYMVTGVDPQETVLEAARARAPGAEFLCAGAEDIPARDGSFGAAIFLNALHHLPEPVMEPGLAEAWRLLRPGGLLLVVEPLARGSFFAAMRRVDDETEVRAQALAALERFTAGRGLEPVIDREVDRVSRFASVEGFLTYLSAADPARGAVIAAERAAITADFLACADAGADPAAPHVLIQPHLFRGLRKPGG